MPQPPLRVLFVCTRNSARSQMAAGFARALGLDAQSAGMEPGPAIHPATVTVMAEKGIDLQNQTPSSFDLRIAETMDVVVTVCGEAEEQCPILPPTVRHLHWPLLDPATASGSPETVLTVFRQVRDDLEQRVAALAHDLRG